MQNGEHIPLLIWVNMIDKGVIVADGRTKEILADAKLLKAHGLEKP